MHVVADVAVSRYANSRRKRIFDFVVALILFILALPVIGLLWILVVIETGRPGFYRQFRPGLHRKDILIYKLRSMHYNPTTPITVCRSGRDARVTRVGRWLRKLRLDELPQLWSVVRGDMSLVGPRPHPLPIERTIIAHINDYYIRNNVRPGLAGRAKLQRVHEGDHHDEFQDDVQWMKTATFWGDLLILLHVPIVMIRGFGTSD